MRIIIMLTCAIAISYCSIAQNFREKDLKTQTYSYAYITVEGKAFGKKLKVTVDLGDKPEQIQTGNEYSEILTNKKSYAAVLNYMSEKDYELVESRDISYSVQGTGGSSGIILIMRKKSGG